MRTKIDIRNAGPDDDEHVVSALTGAFFHDPVISWAYPDESRRQSALPGFFSLMTEAISRQGASHTVGDGHGAALWVPPGSVVVEDERAAAFQSAIAALSPEDIERVAAVVGMLDETHPHEPCWYLNLLGVAPEHQGAGIGSALLEQALARSDRDCIPAYLEATSPDNRRLYERHGFAVERVLDSYGGPPLWAMWRQPNATRADA